MRLFVYHSKPKRGLIVKSVESIEVDLLNLQNFCTRLDCQPLDEWLGQIAALSGLSDIRPLPWKCIRNILDDLICFLIQISLCPCH